MRPSSGYRRDRERYHARNRASAPSLSGESGLAQPAQRRAADAARPAWPCRRARATPIAVFEVRAKSSGIHADSGHSMRKNMPRSTIDGPRTCSTLAWHSRALEIWYRRMVARPRNRAEGDARDKLADDCRYPHALRAVPRIRVSSRPAGPGSGTGCPSPITVPDLARRPMSGIADSVRGRRRRARRRCRDRCPA